MKRMLAVFLLLAATVRADPDDKCVIACPANVLGNATISNRVATVFLNMWSMDDTVENRAWVMSGWSTFYPTWNTNISVKVYVVTADQVRGIPNQSWIDSKLATIGNTNVVGRRTNNVFAALDYWSLKPK